MASQALTKGALWMQNVDYPASWDRALIDALYASEGVIDGFVVSANGGLGIAVSGGRAVVQGDEVAGQGKYLVDQDAVTTLTLASVGTTRTEYVYIAINDAAVAGGRAGDNVSIETTTGAIPDSALLIATLTLTSGTVTITAGMIADSRSFADVVPPASITTAKLADNSVTSAKIVNGTIVTVDLADAAVTTAKLADNSVTSAKIVDGTIVTADLADHAVSLSKLSAAVQATLDAVDPADAIIAIAGSTAPTGWALCDGTAYSRTTYAATFARIGTTYGVGDGSFTFNVPDLRSRFIAGKGTATWSDALNEKNDPSAKDAVAVAHTHTFVHDHATSSITADQTGHTHAPFNYGTGTETVLTHLTSFNGHDAYVPHDLSKTAVAPAGYTNMAVAFGSALQTTDPTITISGTVPNNPGTDVTAGQTPTSVATDKNLPPYVTLNYCIRLR